MARTASLSRTASLAGGLVLVIVSLTAGVLIARTAARLLAREQEQALIGVTVRIGHLVRRTLAERQHEAQVLASIPELVHQAEQAAAVPPDEHNSSNMLLTNGAARLQLALLASRSSFGEIGIVDRRGLTALASSPPLALDRSQESWWRTATEQGSAIGTPIADSLRGMVTLEFAAALQSRGEASAAGVLVAVYPLEKLGFEIQENLTGTQRTSVEVIDDGGRVVFSRASPLDVTKAFREPNLLAMVGRRDSVHLIERGREHTAVMGLPEVGWHVVVREPSQGWVSLLALARHDLLLSGSVFIMAAGLVLFVLVRLLRQRVLDPVRNLEAVSAEVRRGNLAVVVAFTSGARVGR